MSDRVTTVESLKQEVRKFCEDRNWDQFHGPKDLAIGAATEAAELLELFRFKSEAEIGTELAKPEYRDKVRHELVDVLFFVLRFAQIHRIDLAEAFAEKMAANARKYPVELARDSNVKYTELKKS